MAWDDWVFGIATGGLYNVGKTVYKAGEAADEAGDALEEISDGAGSALAAVGSTVTKLGKDLSSFLKELEELLTIKRVTARSEEDLWDEEVDRLTKLREYEQELMAELQAMEKEDDDKSWFESLMGGLLGQLNGEELALRMKLAMVRATINEILYEEPGVVPTTLYSVKEILERFNTLEQPRIEELLDSVNNNLEETEDILEEVEKLFVIKTWRAIPVGNLSDAVRVELEQLEVDRSRLHELVGKDKNLVRDLKVTLIAAQPEHLKMPKVIGANIGQINKAAESIVAQAQARGTVKVRNEPLKQGLDSGAVGSARVGSARDVSGRVDSGHNAAGSANQPAASRAYDPGPGFAFKGKVSPLTMQPIAASVSTALNQNAVTGYLENHQAIDGRIRYFEREIFKVDKKIHRIRFELVEEPGVIPKILDEVWAILSRLREEAQPRVEALLDSVNDTVEETTQLISTLNSTLLPVQGALEFFNQYGKWIKIAIAGVGLLVIGILVATLVVLVRMALGL